MSPGSGGAARGDRFAGVPRPAVPPPAPGPAVALAPAVTVLRLGAAVLEVTVPRVALRIGAADAARRGPAAVEGADVLVADLTGIDAPDEGVELVRALGPAAPVVVTGAGMAVVEAALAAGAAGVLVDGDVPANDVVAAAGTGAALLVVGCSDAAGGRQEALARAAAALDPGPLLVEAAAAPADGPGLALLVVDPGAGAPPGEPDLVRARRVGAITRGVVAGGRLVLTDDLHLARRTVEVLGALLTAEER